MIFSNNTPYTYLIGWSKLNMWYYGCQTAKHCHPDNLWKSYFTSSDYVTEFRLENGDPDVIQVRKIFIDSDYKLRTAKCKLWEEKVIEKIDAVKNPNWLNKQNAGKDFNSTNKIVVRDNKTQKNILISCDDPRVISGELVSPNKGIAKKKEPCKFCNKLVGTAAKNQHQNRCVKNPNPTPLKELVYKECDYCRKILDKANLSKHIKICEHNPNRVIPKFNCYYCGIPSKDPGNLKLHEGSCDYNPNKKLRKKIKKICIDDIIYDSTTLASIAVGINKGILQLRARSKIHPNIFYIR